MTLPMFPKFYWFPRGKGCRKKRSDLAWIIKLMRHIPEDKQGDVVQEYENIFLRGNNDRKAANTYLHEIAVKYRDSDKGTKALKMAKEKPE